MTLTALQISKSIENHEEKLSQSSQPTKERHSLEQIEFLLKTSHQYLLSEAVSGSDESTPVTSVEYLINSYGQDIVYEEAGPIQATGAEQIGLSADVEDTNTEEDDISKTLVSVS